MNEFFLHEQLCALENIAKQYPQGLDLRFWARMFFQPIFYR